MRKIPLDSYCNQLKSISSREELLATDLKRKVFLLGAEKYRKKRFLAWLTKTLESSVSSLEMKSLGSGDMHAEARLSIPIVKECAKNLVFLGVSWVVLVMLEQI